MLGIHQSFDNPMRNIPYYAKSIGADTFQIFTRNNRNLRQRYITMNEVTSFNLACIENGIDTIVIHAPYIMNPASPERDKWERARDIILEDLRFNEYFTANVKYVLHPGSFISGSNFKAIDRLVEMLNGFGTNFKTEICVETMAGQGTQLLCNETEIRYFLANAFESISLTFDSCHVFASGMDVIHSFRSFANRIGVVHLNGSSKASGTRVDRHSSLFDGYLPTSTNVELAKLVRKEIPVILEVPGDYLVEDFNELKKII